LIAEEAANILGGFSAHHFFAATPQGIARLRDMATAVLGRLDDEDVAGFLRERIEVALTEVGSFAALAETDARIMLKDLGPMLARIAPTPSDGQLLSDLTTHVHALTWAAASENRSAFQVIRIEDHQPHSDKARSAYSIVEQWIAVVRDLLGPDCTLAFAPLDLAEGSLIITLRIDADADTHDDIARQLRGAKDVPLTSSAAEELIDAPMSARAN
jgi:hypothetical protein